ncbi:hypothetical protein T05_488 [Trichinella murrelli]|uniref:Uncharacterized protein n=1 Tax=Trichinella murrelli TaxID=144512 RepID=A0A0V0SYD6_9BILA|nr:hypothetical protein T05_14730 [Trichinella murrelli]KRX31672.1 hypothetical protein T05_488 [Trichinella murrelli]
MFPIPNFNHPGSVSKEFQYGGFPENLYRNYDLYPPSNVRDRIRICT